MEKRKAAIRKQIEKEKVMQKSKHQEIKSDSTKLRSEEIYLLELVKGELTGHPLKGQHPSLNWDRLVYIAHSHGVLPLLYHSLAECEELHPQIRQQSQVASQRMAMQSYRLLFLSKYLVEGFRKADIPVVLLKGVGTASYYPVPEYRKSGDVDLLLLDPDKLPLARKVMEELGCKEEEHQSSLHHIVYKSGDEVGIEIELHTLLVEPFDNNKINRYMENKILECGQNVKVKQVMGMSLPVLDTAYHAYELLLHMLQHFLRSGFGLKLLCDWVVFWNHDVPRGEKEKYLQLVEESGVRGFSDMITLVCCKYLGLKEENMEWMKISSKYEIDEFVKEILEAEAFGKSSQERMVALRGNGIFDYIREFHHQMHLNFPKTGKCFLFWPVLWIVTLARFLHNNKKYRKTSGLSILKKAGQRGKMVKQMKLFQ